MFKAKAKAVKKTPVPEMVQEVFSVRPAKGEVKKQVGASLAREQSNDRGQGPLLPQPTFVGLYPWWLE
jgi:hypothetical protein